MTSKSFKTLHIWDTTYNADSVEWCPITPYKNTFVCGTYHLIENDKRAEVENDKGYFRTGGVTIFTVLKEKLEVGDAIKCPAVLDLKWCGKKLNNNIALAVANAEGEVCLFHFENKKLEFVSKYVLKKESGDFLALSLDWSKEGESDLVCAGDSKGNINVFKVGDGVLCLIKKWNAHSLEAWITCFDSFNTNILYSGGDEALLKVWDCRGEVPRKIGTVSKHTAGVTSLNSNIYKEFNLISGSYDETVHFWDTRKMSRPLEVIKASGGVWRLKWEPKERSRYVLGACVYGGFQIYDTNTFTVVANYKEHKSLAYGADWCYFDDDEYTSLLGKSEVALIATCSFNDHKLCVSLWNESSDFEGIS